MFSGCTVPPKETENGGSDQETSPIVNTSVLLMPFHAWKCACMPFPTAISGGVCISGVPGCHLFRQMSSQ